MSTSTTLRIEPRDSLIVRDGRPNEGRSHSSTLSFPFPGTVAGMVRTRLGSEPGQGFVLDADGDALARLREVAIRGPLLVRGGDASPASADADPFGPVPADALPVPALAGGDLSPSSFFLQPAIATASSSAVAATRR